MTKIYRIYLPNRKGCAHMYIDKDIAERRLKYYKLVNPKYRMDEVYTEEKLIIDTIVYMNGFIIKKNSEQPVLTHVTMKALEKWGILWEVYSYEGSRIAFTPHLDGTVEFAVFIDVKDLDDRYKEKERMYAKILKAYKEWEFKK